MPDFKVGEAAFQGQLIQAACLFGWSLIYHTRDSRGSRRGFPDLVLVNPATGRVIFAELKTTVRFNSKDHGMSPDQIKWAEGLMEAVSNGSNVEYYLWSPMDWNHIEETLMGGEKPWV